MLFDPEVVVFGGQAGMTLFDDTLFGVVLEAKRHPMGGPPIFTEGCDLQWATPSSMVGGRNSQCNCSAKMGSDIRTNPQPQESIETGVTHIPTRDSL